MLLFWSAYVTLGALLTVVNVNFGMEFELRWGRRSRWATRGAVAASISTAIGLCKLVGLN